jgi:hypothetical protein
MVEEGVVMGAFSQKKNDDAGRCWALQFGAAPKTNPATGAGFGGDQAIKRAN